MGIYTVNILSSMVSFWGPEAEPIPGEQSQITPTS